MSDHLCDPLEAPLCLTWQGAPSSVLHSIPAMLFKGFFFSLSKLLSLLSSILSHSMSFLDLSDELRVAKLVFRNLLSKSFTVTPYCIMRILAPVWVLFL